MTSNICRANFNGGRTAQGNNRFQWDYGQILEISGIENLPDPFTAQFSNTPVLGTAKSTVGTGGRVEIPNEYFVSGQNIYCFIVLHTDEDDGRTVYIATIPVTKRPKPIDDPITPTQQSTIDTAIAALQAGVAKAEGFAQTATEQAGIATEAATTATEAAETATGAVADVEAAATRAETAAEGAGASATAAEASATDAESAKTAALAAKGAAETAAANAEQSATDAGNYAGLAEEAETSAAASATAAEASATAAAGSASAASGSASQAAQKASEASASATAAETSATNAEAAKTGAETAQAAAEAAQGKAEEAAANAEQSAETAEWYAERVERFLPTDTASGEIASFPDGADSVPMQSVVVSMEPIQDLHGYDHPWPAGGGKNLLDINNIVVGNTNNWSVEVNGDTLTVTHKTAYVTGTPTFAFNQPSGTYVISMGSINITGQVSLYVNGAWAKTINNGDTFTIDAANTNEIRFSAQESQPTTITKIQIESGSTPTAYAPYSNICPISGRTGADIEHTGKNLINISDIVITSPSYLFNDAVSLPVGEYVFSITRADSEPPTSSISIALVMDDGTNATVYRTATEGNRRIIYIRATRKIVAMRVYAVAGSYTQVQLELVSTATAYEPYQGNTISITFPTEAGTVYGGTLDVVSGDLVVDRAMVDLGTLNWSNAGMGSSAPTGHHAYVSYGLGAKYAGSDDKASSLICSRYVAVSRNNTYRGDAEGFTINAYGDLYAYIAEYATDTASDFKAAMNGVQLCYELATPITYHLTPQEVRTLLGQNNVWSDAGDTAVTYKADVQMYIDKRISALS